MTTLRRACMTRSRHEIDSHTAAGPDCDGQDGADVIGVAAAAETLKLSRRTVQRLVATDRLLGVRVGSIWALDRRAVLALANERKASA